MDLKRRHSNASIVCPLVTTITTTTPTKMPDKIALSLSTQFQGGNPVKETDDILSSEVVAVLNELGHYNRITNVYQLNPGDHGPCLRDLIRFLRNDGATFLVRRQMGMSNVISNDLLPIVEQHTTKGTAVTDEGKAIMDKVIRLLVDLTNPTILHFRDQRVPKDDKYLMQIFMELQNYLYNFKLAFASHKRFWIIISKFITHILELDEESRQMEDNLLLERIIVLIRNVLHIPVISTSIDLEVDTSVQDRLIEQFHKSELLTILQYMISSEDHHEYCFHLIEILNLLFREQNAEFLAQSTESDRAHVQGSSADNTRRHSMRSQYEIDRDYKDFEELRFRELQTASNSLLKQKAQDFTRFSGAAFVVKDMKSISDRDMIIHKAYRDPTVAIDLNREKVAQKRARNRKPMEENVGGSDATGVQRIHRSNRHIRSILYDFCGQFLADSYNQFMALVRDNLSRGAAQDNDQTYYLWAIQFFMEFSRNRTINVSPEDKYKQVYQTLSTGTFHYLQTLVDDYLDHLQLKKEFKYELGDWSKRLHGALRAYRELLFSLETLSKMNLPEASMMCYRIKTDIFTEPEYRELLLRLLQGYNEERMSKAYLRDLIETNHSFLRMLEYHAKISFDFKVKIKKKNRKKKKEKKANEQQESGEDGEKAPEQSLEDIWQEIDGPVVEQLNSPSTPDEVDILGDEQLAALFDQATDKDIDVQKLDIMRAIGRLLKAKDVKKAVGLYREARHALAGVDLDNTFGDFDIQPDEEMTSLKGIFMANIPDDKKRRADDEEHDDEENDDDETNEFEDQAHRVVEAKFSIDDTVRRYANPNVIKTYRLLLANYQLNSSRTNHAIVRMLHRIAVDMKMTPMFFNLGYFVIFQRILDDANLKHQATLRELGKFAYFVIAKFFKLLRKYPKLACEICFLVSPRESYQMEVGFVEEEVARIKTLSKKGAWSEEQNYELEVLYKEYKDQATGEKDVVELIQEHLIDDTRTRRQIINQLKKLDIIQASDIKKKTTKGAVWSDQELKELVELYELYKDNVDMARLTTTIEVVTDGGDGEDSQKPEVAEEPEKQNNPEPILASKTKSNKFDIIDAIRLRLSTADKRSRRQIMRQLKIMGVYDHQTKTKWAPEQIDKLREVFDQLFEEYRKFEEAQLSETIADGEDVIVEDKKKTDFDFAELLMSKFKESNKSIGQIVRQLRRMGFENELKIVGLFKGGKKKVIDEVESDGSCDEEELDDDIHEQEDDGVVIQFDDDDDGEVDDELEPMEDKAQEKDDEETRKEMEESKAKRKAAKERLMSLQKKMANSQEDLEDENDDDDEDEHGISINKEDLFDDNSLNALSEAENNNSDQEQGRKKVRKVRKVLLSDAEDDEPEGYDRDEEDNVDTTSDKENSTEPAKSTKTRKARVIVSDSEDEDILDTDDGNKEVTMQVDNNVDDDEELSSSIGKRKVMDSDDDDDDDDDHDVVADSVIKKKRIIVSDDEDE